jgi:hypothetical protein
MDAGYRRAVFVRIGKIAWRVRKIHMAAPLIGSGGGERRRVPTAML